MLASLLPKKSITLIETNAKLGAKLLVSGGGKCNITNRCMGTEYYLGDETFVESVLKAFSEKALLGWLERQNLHPVLKKETQFFCKESAKEILDIFLKQSRKQRVVTGEKVLDVSKRDGFFYVKTDKRTLTARSVVVASGGLSFPKLGASDIGCELPLAKELEAS